MTNTDTQFLEDMEAGGFKAYNDGGTYGGRHNYTGPAIVIDYLDDYQDVIRATGVRLMIDQLGTGYVVYPRHR